MTLVLALPGAVVSHRAAAAVWKLPGSDKASLEFTTPRGHRAPCAGVIVHRTTDLATPDVVNVNGIPVTSVTRTLLDLGSVVDEETVEIALDAALCRRMTTIDRLQRRLDALGGRGRRGTATLRKLLEERHDHDGVPESALETKTRRVLRLLRKARLPLPECQYEIAPYRIDFAYPQYKIAIEAESYERHSGKRAWHRDWARRNHLTSLGWLVLHFTWEDITKRPSYVLAQVTAALKERGAMRG